MAARPALRKPATRAGRGADGSSEALSKQETRAAASRSTRWITRWRPIPGCGVEAGTGTPRTCRTSRAPPRRQAARRGAVPEPAARSGVGQDRRCAGVHGARAAGSRACPAAGGDQPEAAGRARSPSCALHREAFAGRQGAPLVHSAYRRSAARLSRDARARRRRSQRRTRTARPAGAPVRQADQRGHAPRQRTGPGHSRGPRRRRAQRTGMAPCALGESVWGGAGPRHRSREPQGGAGRPHPAALGRCGGMVADAFGHAAADGIDPAVARRRAGGTSRLRGRHLVGAGCRGCPRLAGPR